MSTNTNSKAKTGHVSIPVHTFKRKTMAMAFAVIAAVILPQILHMGGRALGIGSGLGEILLPMHLPILLVGFLAGSYAGTSAGMLAPVISYALTGMPALPMLPFIILELTVYGFTAGRMKNFHIPAVLKVFLVQLAGRGFRFLIVALAVYGFDSNSVTMAAGWTNITTGMLGMLLQLICIPVILHFMEE